MTSERPTADRHVPVMLDRVLDLMAPGIDQARAAGRTPVALDGTLGMGGHTEALPVSYTHLTLPTIRLV